jgi:hypothetical protein
MCPEQPRSRYKSRYRRLRRIAFDGFPTMNDRMVQKLHGLFSSKMQEIFEKTTPGRHGEEVSLEEFNAWQDYLNNTLSLEVVDIEQGGQPGVYRIDRLVKVVRIMNPSNAVERSSEFIVIPYEIAEKILIFGWIPDDLRTPD